MNRALGYLLNIVASHTSSSGNAAQQGGPLLRMIIKALSAGHSKSAVPFIDTDSYSNAVVVVFCCIVLYHFTQQLIQHSGCRLSGYHKFF